MKKDLKLKSKVAQSLNLDKKELQSMAAMRATFNNEVRLWANQNNIQGSSQGVILPDKLQEKYEGIEEIANMTAQISDAKPLSAESKLYVNRLTWRWGSR